MSKIKKVPFRGDYAPNELADLTPSEYLSVLPNSSVAVDGGCSIDVARDALRLELMEGASCPCCGDLTKIYWRNLSSVMARFLIWLYKNHQAGHEWVYCREAPFRGGDYAKVGLWDLAVKQGETDAAKRTSGYWRLTVVGEQFVLNRLVVAKYAASFRGQNVGLSVEELNILGALSSGSFNYEELMGKR